MPYLLTDDQLQSHILSLKDRLDDFCLQNRKVVFFDALSLYDHMKRQPRVTEILDEIEPYIPMSLGEESMQLFLQAAYETEANETAPDSFLHKARSEFVKSLCDAETPDAWARLLSICGAIRDIKEQLIHLAAT
jgi:hypothetical protein